MELTPELFASALAWFAIFVFSTTVHEAAHAWAAQRLGDDTAYLGGQVSLNPIPHIVREPFGMVIVPLISFFLQNGQWMIGWASAPYDPQWAARYPKRAGLMALAGPVSNLILCLLAGIAIRIGIAAGYLQVGSYSLMGLVGGTEAAGSQGTATVLSVFFGLNLVLFLFNLIPLPPMDGSAVLQLFLPEDVGRKLQEFLYQPMWGLLGLIIAWRTFSIVLWPVFDVVVRILYAGV